MSNPTRLRTITLLVIGVVVSCLLTGCAPANPGQTAEGAGFLAGLWDGLTVWIAFFLDLIGKPVGIYDVRNTGLGYDLGFLLGCGSALGAGGGLINVTIGGNRRS